MLIYPNWQFFVKNLFKFVCIASILPFTKPNCLHEDDSQIFPRSLDGYEEIYFYCSYEHLDLLDFYLVGDIGGMQEKNANGYFEHYPSEGQETVSKYMNKYQNNQKIDLFGDNHLFSPKFVMSLGDNFYDNGIGPGEAEDRFGKTFNPAYFNLSLPWISIAGNNDYKAPEGEKITFEKARERVLEQIGHTLFHIYWNLPSEYYVHSYSMNGFNIVFIMIDTTLLCGGSRKDSVNFVQGSSKKSARDQHYIWLRKTLKDYSPYAHYLFVAGHYPLYLAEGDRAFTCTAKLQQLFVQYNISAYLAGHEHSLKYVNVNVPGKGSFPQIVSGAATKIENCLQEKHVFSKHENTYTNMAQNFEICYPYGLNTKQIEENNKLRSFEENNIETDKMILEGRKKNLERKLKSLEKKNIHDEETKEQLDQTKEELKALDELLDEDNYNNGGFIAVRITKENARFSFFGVGTDKLFSLKEENSKNNKLFRLGIVEIASRSLQ
ncbi:hypothetical protein ACQ4LE_010709 [Meloidogyne hapla]